MVRLVMVAGMLVGLVACFEEEPCDRYVEYVCDCHGGEPGYDCQEYQRTYAGADPIVQDQCAIDLAALQDADEAEGHECVSATDTGI